MRKQKNSVPLSKADREFFYNFFEEHKNFLYHTAASYVIGAAERDDLVQEAVMRLMKNISVLRQLTRCKTSYYIVVTVRTAYIDMPRRNRKITVLPLNLRIQARKQRIGLHRSLIRHLGLFPQVLC